MKSNHKNSMHLVGLYTYLSAILCVCVFFLNVTIRWPAFLLIISKVKWKAYNTLNEASCHVMFNSVVTNIYIIILYIIRSIERAFKGVRIDEWKRFLNALIFVCVYIYTNDIFVCTLYLIVFVLKVIAVHQEKQESGEVWYELSECDLQLITLLWTSWL